MHARRSSRADVRPSVPGHARVFRRARTHAPARVSARGGQRSAPDTPASPAVGHPSARRTEGTHAPRLPLLAGPALPHARPALGDPAPRPALSTSPLPPLHAVRCLNAPANGFGEEPRFAFRRFAPRRADAGAGAESDADAEAEAASPVRLDRPIAPLHAARRRARCTANGAHPRLELGDRQAARRGSRGACACAPATPRRTSPSPPRPRVARRSGARERAGGRRRGWLPRASRRLARAGTRAGVRRSLFTRATPARGGTRRSHHRAGGLLARGPGLG